MSLFNDMNTLSNPLSKKKKEQDINEQIDRLTEFYNALSDDTNMAYIIDELEKIHDMQVLLETNITLLKDELSAFEKVFDEKNSYTDETLTLIREDATDSVKKTINSNINKDVESVKSSLEIAESNALDSIDNIFTKAVKRIKQNNSTILKIKQEKKQVNYLGFLILLGSMVASAITFSFLAESSFLKMEYYKISSKISKQEKVLHHLDSQNRKKDELLEAIIYELYNKKSN